MHSEEFFGLDNALKNAGVHPLAGTQHPWLLLVDTHLKARCCINQMVYTTGTPINCTYPSNNSD